MESLINISPSLLVNEPQLIPLQTPVDVFMETSPIAKALERVEPDIVPPLGEIIIFTGSINHMPPRPGLMTPNKLKVCAEVSIKPPK